MNERQIEQLRLAVAFAVLHESTEVLWRRANGTYWTVVEIVEREGLGPCALMKHSAIISLQDCDPSQFVKTEAAVDP